MPEAFSDGRGGDLDPVADMELRNTYLSDYIVEVFPERQPEVEGLFFDPDLNEIAINIELQEILLERLDWLDQIRESILPDEISPWESSAPTMFSVLSDNSIGKISPYDQAAEEHTQWAEVQLEKLSGKVSSRINEVTAYIAGLLKRSQSGKPPKQGES